MINNKFIFLKWQLLEKATDVTRDQYPSSKGHPSPSHPRLQKTSWGNKTVSSPTNATVQSDLQRAGHLAFITDRDIDIANEIAREVLAIHASSSLDSVAMPP